MGFECSYKQLHAITMSSMFSSIIIAITIVVELHRTQVRDRSPIISASTIILILNAQSYTLHLKPKPGTPKPRP